MIKTAEELANVSGKRRPKQANLRRAISTAYYALFHALCNNCANCFVGKGSDYPRAAWRRAYRSLNHGFAKEACNHTKKEKLRVLEKFPLEIQDFAYQFYTMQLKRHDADYDPYFTATKSGVMSDIIAVRKAVSDFEAAPLLDRRAFSTWVLFPDR
ncbi:MAG: hypothetical protein KDJ48_12810 [Nitratireductor sp.]|nr:hypothetical protein [Nitratireductor sp.]MCB1460120.1 hypothetical protein [Nitratireductor sp.]